MSQAVITKSFSEWKAQQAVNNKAVVLDEFVFAYIPDLDVNKPISNTETIPAADKIVHRQAVSKCGVVNDNSVVYSVTLGADVGDFDFNWIGLTNKATGTLAMIIHAPAQSKVKNASGQQGNVLVRSMLMEYSGAQAATEITTPAETWQIDFTARLAAVDERQRLENIDLYGAAAFMGDGWLVAKNGSQFYVTAGSGYVRGLRTQLPANQNITITTKPVKVWIDVCWTGTLTSVWGVASKITVATTLTDYVQDGIQHYVFAVASIDANGNITDLRPIGSLDSQDMISGFLKKNKNLADLDDKDEARKALTAAKKGDNADITSLSGLTIALSVSQGGTGAKTTGEARKNLQAAQSGANSDITSLSGLTTALSISQGGTGAKTLTGARQNLELDRFAQGESETHMTSASRRYVLRLWDNGAWGVFDSTNQEWVPLAVEKGGTGAVNASGARKNLQAAQSGANSDITSISGLTTALSVPQGGTGATSAKEAREKLFAAERGGNSDITSLSGLTTALSVSQGGTGAKTATEARANIYAGGISTALNDDNGWWKCADTGLIFQHGKVVVQAGGRITFRAAFPNKCCAVILTDNDGYKDCGVLGATTTYAPFTSNQSGLVTVGYIATGY